MSDGRRTLLILMSIFGVLAVITLLQAGADSQQMTEQQARFPFERVFTEFSENEIQAIRLQEPATERALTIAWDHAANQWIAPGTDGVLDQNTATLIARTMVLLPYDRALDIATGADISAYGFESNPTLLIQIVLVSGEQHGVIVGGISPTASNFYGLVDERPQIFLLQSPAIEFLLDQLETPPTA
jgi:hypothetical protein